MVSGEEEGRGGGEGREGRGGREVRRGDGRRGVMEKEVK